MTTYHLLKKGQIELGTRYPPNLEQFYLILGGHYDPNDWLAFLLTHSLPSDKMRTQLERVLSSERCAIVNTFEPTS